MKLDPVVRRETAIIALGALIQCALMQLVFLAIGKWWFGVLLSSLLVGGAVILHFFTLGLTVQRALKLENEDERKQLMKVSQMSRMLLPAAAIVIGALIPAVFDFWALLPPIVFNRITLIFRGVYIARHPAADAVTVEATDITESAAESEEAE